MAYMVMIHAMPMSDADSTCAMECSECGPFLICLLEESDTAAHAHLLDEHGVTEPEEYFPDDE